MEKILYLAAKLIQGLALTTNFWIDPPELRLVFISMLQPDWLKSMAASTAMRGVHFGGAASRRRRSTNPEVVGPMLDTCEETKT